MADKPKVLPPLIKRKRHGAKGIWVRPVPVASDAEAVVLAYKHAGTVFFSKESGDLFEHVPHSGCTCYVDAEFPEVETPEEVE